MTIIEAIDRVNLLKPNTYSLQEKVKWLSTLDGTVKLEIIDTHEGGEEAVFAGYDESTPVDTPLMIPPPYDEVYLFWLEAKIDYWNGEYTRYNNSIAMFNAAYADYQEYYHATHRPRGGRGWHFGRRGAS